jgi:hypothetical protein
MRGKRLLCSLALSLCTSFDIDVLSFRNYTGLSEERVARFGSALVAPKQWVGTAGKVLVHEWDRFLSSPSDGKDRFGIGQVGGTGMMSVGFCGTPWKLRWSSEASNTTILSPLGLCIGSSRWGRRRRHLTYKEWGGEGKYEPQAPPQMNDWEWTEDRLIL